MTTIPNEAVEAACKATVLGEDIDGLPMHLEPREAIIAISAALPHLAKPVDGERLAKAAEDGWNACRRQVYLLSEDYTERTHALTGVDTVEGNFYRGQYDVAKSFAKAFSAFEAKDCDYFKQTDCAALGAGTVAQEPVGWTWHLDPEDKWQYVDGAEKPRLGLPTGTEERVTYRAVYAAPPAAVQEPGVVKDATHSPQTSAMGINADLLKALKYVRRYLKPEDHDVSYVDDVIDNAEGRGLYATATEVALSIPQSDPAPEIACPCTLIEQDEDCPIG
ncbi:MAG TPA: hypothetical protein VGC14_25245 [Rhizobium sp.]